jgi:hypothetical protein
MDPAPALGAAMSRGSWSEVRRSFLALVATILLIPSTGRAQERFALIVSGATGGPTYARQYKQWCDTLSQTLAETMKFDASRVTVLAEGEDPASASTAANVRRAINTVRDTMSRNDLFLIVLIGHGTSDGPDAKFNLVGPDLEAAEWGSLVKAIPGRLVLVNTTGGSFPFIERLAGPRRVIITATNSSVQKYDTVFPDYFIRALTGDESDIDKNGRVSILEAFNGASSAVRRHYQQRGQLSTEHAVIDDNGDGVGREAASQGEDGSLASRTYLDVAAPDAAPTDEVLLQLLQQRATLEAEIEELRIKRAFMQQAEYAKEFERLMIAVARVSRDIRARTKT